MLYILYIYIYIYKYVIGSVNHKVVELTRSTHTCIYTKIHNIHTVDKKFVSELQVTLATIR